MSYMLKRETNNNIRRAIEHYKKGMSAFQSREYSKAIASYTTAIALRPG
jgi:hypothetical protein